MTSIRKCCLLLIFNFNWVFTLSKSESDIETKFKSIDLPPKFLLGAGTSAFQIEGAWNTHGKTESHIEWVMHKLYSNVSAHVASDSYHKFKEDAKVLKETELNLYRFSMSWPRLLPTGGVNNINRDGVEYYSAVLDELEKTGVTPIVMLHHFDHPINLEQTGGWFNDTIIELYKEYARFVFQQFGHRVKYFITFNEPNIFCNAIYSVDWEKGQTDEFSKTSRAYKCGQNLLKAHAEVYHMYHKDFNPKKDGQISISISCENYESKNQQDHVSDEIAFQFVCGWIAHPIFSKSGDYSELMKKMVQESSKLGQSKLPVLSEEWIKRIRGSADFFALSHYSSYLVEPATSKSTAAEVSNLYMSTDSKLIVSRDHKWTQASNGFYVVPSGLRSILKKIKNAYNNPAVIILENGYANDGRMEDTDRIEFLYAHIKEAIDAVNDDQCDVRAYLYWSLIDSFEFGDGFTAHFGLANVDFNHPDHPRIIRKSGYWLRDVIRSRKLSIKM